MFVFAFALGYTGGCRLSRLDPVRERVLLVFYIYNAFAYPIPIVPPPLVCCATPLLPDPASNDDRLRNFFGLLSILHFFGVSLEFHRIHLPNTIFSDSTVSAVAAAAVPVAPAAAKKLTTDQLRQELVEKHLNHQRDRVRLTAALAQVVA